MQNKKFSIGTTAMLVIVVATQLATCMHATAQTEKVLHSFNGIDGSAPNAGLILDASGNLYGTTLVGGPQQGGTVFELTPTAGGDWDETVLHYFPHYTEPEEGNLYAGLIFDNAGNLYATTALGGVEFPLSDCDVGCGTVLELMPKTGGGWADKILHEFALGGGEIPFARLIFDASSNLYGTTFEGGKAGGGTVFELMPTAKGGWAEKVLHSFGIRPNDATNPYAALVFDASGNLYGTTINGGTLGDGAVFELVPQADGTWAEKILHSFNGKNGKNFYGGVIFDHAGNLYGTTNQGGLGSCPTDQSGCGTVFELTPQAGGTWRETILHYFSSGAGGSNPFGDLIFDDVGNLYGTTEAGGTGLCAVGSLVFGCGTVFELSPKLGGGWTEKVLHNFNNDGEDGVRPQAGLIFDADGNLDGTTTGGGANGLGTVFEVTP